jgi:hypothetical protein
MQRKTEMLRLDEAQDADFTDILAKHNLKLSELFSYLAKSAYVNQRTGNLVELRPDYKDPRWGRRKLARDR